MTHDEEAKRATKLLKGKIVREIKRTRAKEVLIEFADGTRLYIDHTLLRLLDALGLELGLKQRAGKKATGIIAELTFPG